MNKGLKMMSFYALILMHSTLSSAPNEITKVFHHQGTITDKIVFYFSGEPIYNTLPAHVTQAHERNQSKSQKVVLFLPQTRLRNAEVKDMTKKISAAHRMGYSIAFEDAKTPIVGTKIIITYDPQMVQFETESFNAIKGEKGISLSFHNKAILGKLKSSTDTLLHYAWNEATDKKRPKIMIDIGHGGSDDGAVGYLNTKEKNITYQVGTKLASLLKKEGCDVYLSRHGDTFVALDERTSLANKKKVDLFLSLHANSSPNPAIGGLETYWLASSLLKGNKLASDKEYAALMARKDSLNLKYATMLHSAVLEGARTMYPLQDRTVKTAVSQVLLGTDLTIPTVLIEMGFLSNCNDTHYLRDQTYQKIVAQSIAQGILKFLTTSL